MTTAIKTRIIKIGNSQGIRIPKLLLEQSGLEGEVEINLEGNHLTIRSVAHPIALIPSVHTSHHYDRNARSITVRDRK